MTNVVEVFFLEYQQTARCRVANCGSHENLLKFQFTSLDYFFVCQNHLQEFFNEAISGVLKKTFLEVDFVKINNDYFISLIEQVEKELGVYRAHSAIDLKEELIKRLKGGK